MRFREELKFLKSVGDSTKLKNGRSGFWFLIGWSKRSKSLLFKRIRVSKKSKVKANIFNYHPPTLQIITRMLKKCYICIFVVIRKDI